MKGFIFICGNDGTGKSTVAEKLGQKRPDYQVIERSMKDLKKEWKDLISFMDNATLKYTFDPRPTLPVTLSHEGKDYPIYWIILDAPVDVIEHRVEKRLVRSAWESRKSLEYFRERFRELSAYYGLPWVDTTKYTVEQETEEIMRIVESGEYEEIRMVRAEKLVYDEIKANSIEEAVAKALTEECVNGFDEGKLAHGDGFMDDELVKTAKEHKDFKKKLISRWLVKGGIIKVDNGDKISLERDGLKVVVDKKLYYILHTEGESKKVFKIMSQSKYLKDLVVIILKSTIYSHTKQATGEIEGLGQIRSKGTSLFLEMMWRNQLRHAYRALNPCGIIVADFVDTKLVEVVFKKYCEGTDKHSYYGIVDDRSVVLDTGEYAAGPYIRFDWRNPNHVSIKTGTNVILNPYYYLLEEHYGKEKFFEAFLRDGKRAKPFGDRAVYGDILGQLIDVPKTRESAIKMYCTMQSYFNELGLEAKDGCFMLDKTGQMFWSEVNQDCLRVQAKGNHESLDKDIWRAGGSASKDLIVKKWKIFNQMMEDYFAKHTFEAEDLKHYNHYMYQKVVNNILNDKRLKITPLYNDIYQKLRYQSDRRSVVLTLDLHDQKPSLVQSGVVCETHSDGDIAKAFKKISIYPDVLVVDLNGAFGDPHNNREIIKSLGRNNYIYTGGGIRTIEDADDVLKSSVRRVVVSSNTSEAFLKAVSSNRLIVELSVDENNRILIHGRKTNTYIDIMDKVQEMIKVGVKVISITFHQTEGKLQGLPRDQIADIVSRIPEQIEKIIIAGGISTVDDLEFLWSFKRVVPQLGSAVWKGKISIGDIYVAMTRFDGNGLVPAVIQDIHGVIKGLVWMDAVAMRKTCDTRLLYRYSRRTRSVMCKGDTSGNYHPVKQISLDCDSDSILVTVETTKPFCHRNTYSCFNIQSVVKANLNDLVDHIKQRKMLQTYSGRMQRNPGLVLNKIMEEYWEIVCASMKSQVMECSDFLVHFIMYLNSIDVNLDDVLNELNARRWDPHLVKSSSGKHRDLDKHVVIGITCEKYVQETDEFAANVLGFEISRPKGRSLKITSRVVNEEKYKKYFNGAQMLLVGAKPKDMGNLMASGTVDYVITYNTVAMNQPRVFTTTVEVPSPKLRLALIKRRDTVIDTAKWSPSHKAVIATEYLKDVHDFLVNVKKVEEDCFTLTHITGANESFIVNDTKTNFILCDAVVNTGDTIKENDLEIWEIIRNFGELKVGLYAAIKQIPNPTS